MLVYKYIYNEFEASTMVGTDIGWSASVYG